MIERGPRGLGMILYVNVNDLDTFYEAGKRKQELIYVCSSR